MIRKIKPNDEGMSKSEKDDALTISKEESKIRANTCRDWKT